MTIKEFRKIFAWSTAAFGALVAIITHNELDSFLVGVLVFLALIP